jgi:hypothetical protein
MRELFTRDPSEANVWLPRRLSATPLYNGGVPRMPAFVIALAVILSPHPLWSFGNILRSPCEKVGFELPDCSLDIRGCCSDRPTSLECELTHARCKTASFCWYCSLPI